MNMQSIAWQLMSEVDYCAYMEERISDLPFIREGVHLALMAQLGPIIRRTTNRDHAAIMGAVFHHYRKAQ